MIKFICSNCGMILDDSHHHQNSDECIAALGNRVTDLLITTAKLTDILDVQSHTIQEMTLWIERVNKTIPYE